MWYTNAHEEYEYIVLGNSIFIPKQTLLTSNGQENFQLGPRGNIIFKNNNYVDTKTTYQNAEPIWHTYL